MNKITKIILSLVMLFTVAAAPVASVYAAKDIDDAKTEVQEEACKNVKNCNEANPLGGIFQLIANVMLFLVGAVAVIMLIIGGFRYVTSNGDAGAIKGAKDTIMYAIIGIVVAFLAYAAVNFVVTQLTSGAK